MKKMLVLFFCTFVSCFSSEKKQDNQKLSLDFYRLNKTKKFNTFFEISTSESRYNNNSLIDIGVYCSQIKGDYMTIPVKLEDLRSKHSYKSDYFFECKNNGKIDSVFFKNYMNNFQKEFNSIVVPNYYNYKKPKIMGNPRLGNFIIFELNQSCRVYYLRDSKTLIPYWKEHFSKISKIDNNWFYDQAYVAEIN